MKFHTTRQATEAEATAIVEDMSFRTQAGDEFRASLAKHITPEQVAEVIASLPAESQRQFAQRPVRRMFKITLRKSKP